MQKNRIRELRQARKWSLQQLADLIGTSAPQVQRLETSQRQITLRWLERFAIAFSCAQSDLIVEHQPKGARKQAMRALHVVANVQSGKFYSQPHDVYDWAADNQIEAPVPSDYAKHNVFAVLVADDSMNQLYPRGSYLLAVRLADMKNFQLEEDDVVIVERYNAAGVELTARQVAVAANGSINLHPRSNNAKLTAPFILKPTADYLMLHEAPTVALQPVPDAKLAKLRTASPHKNDVVMVMAFIIGQAR